LTCSGNRPVSRLLREGLQNLYVSGSGRIGEFQQVRRGAQQREHSSSWQLACTE
jgi:hypothetical protein